MNPKALFQTVLFFSFVFNLSVIHAQNNEGLYVKPLKQTYNWDEKVIVEFSGLPQRDAYSNLYDDIVIVPAGTPDDKSGEGQRVIVSKPKGQVEFTVPSAGLYEARVYLYEKPGIVSARSTTFRMMSIEEGPLETKSADELLQIAMRNRSRNKELMCGAIDEFFRRKPTPDTPNYKVMKTLQSMCPKSTDKPGPVTKSTVYPLKARYQCYRIMSTGNQVAEDIFILSDKQYKTMDKVGNYSYDPKTRILTFASGPLYHPSQKWVGVYTGKGEPTGNGGKAVSALIEIRKESDMDAGNKRVLQQCSCVQ